jgi:hypothetical protein
MPPTSPSHPNDETSQRFQQGQKVFVNGRQAVFSYELVPGTAVIRYAGELTARAVARRKLTLNPPDC